MGMRGRGFTYVIALVVLAVLGVGLSYVGSHWITEAQRAKEEELLFVGNQYRRAIEQFYLSHPSRTFPRNVGQLLEDVRFPEPKRHLRQAYRDPMSATGEWGSVTTPEGTMIGLFSRSTETPLKRVGFRLRDRSFENKAAYADWKFVAPTAEVNRFIERINRSSASTPVDAR